MLFNSCKCFIYVLFFLRQIFFVTDSECPEGEANHETSFDAVCMILINMHTPSVILLFGSLPHEILKLLSIRTMRATKNDISFSHSISSVNRILGLTNVKEVWFVYWSLRAHRLHRSFCAHFKEVRVTSLSRSWGTSTGTSFKYLSPMESAPMILKCSDCSKGTPKTAHFATIVKQGATLNFWKHALPYT